MGKDLAEKFPAARQVFEEADAALGFALSDLCINGPDEQLQLTENTQPAILTVSIAALRAMESQGVPPAAFVAGHSRGGSSAMGGARSPPPRDAVRTVEVGRPRLQETGALG